MEEIKPSDLELFRQFLLDLEQLPEDTSKDYNFYKRWDADAESIHRIAGAILKFIEDNRIDEEVRKIKYSLKTSFWGQDIRIYKDKISYFSSAINKVEQYQGAKLLRNGLLEKPIQEMTGFEFRTLLLSALRDYQKDQNQK